MWNHFDSITDADLSIIYPSKLKLSARAFDEYSKSIFSIKKFRMKKFYS